MDITYDYYRIFYYVARYGSITRAAEVLLRGQPNITKTIGNLERQLGCTLFVRSKKGVTLTPEGEKLFRHVEIAFENLNKAEQEILSEQALDSGLVSVATTEIGLYGALLRAVSAFRADFPGVKLRLTSMNAPQALEAVRDGLADFAVVSLHENPGEAYRTRIIRNYRELLCCKKGYLDGASDDVFAYPYISVNSSSYTYCFYQQYFSSLGMHKEPDIEVTAADQILPLIKSGMGIGFVSELLIGDALELGLVEEIELQNPPGSRNICLVENRKYSLSPAANKLVSYLF